MAANAGDIVKFVLSNFKPDKSVWAGGGASILTFLAGCVLVGAGVSIPPVSVFGLHLISAAIPLTMTMVAAAAPAVGHIVTSFVSPTEKQAIDQFAAKVQTKVEAVKTIIPVLKQEFPSGKNGQTESGDNPPPSQSNINPG